MACPRHLAGFVLVQQTLKEHPVTVLGTGDKDKRETLDRYLNGYFPLTLVRAVTKLCMDAPGKRKEALQSVQARK